MTIDTVGILVSDTKDVFRIVELVDWAISRWQPMARKEFRLSLPGQVYIDIRISEEDGRRTRTMQACFHCDNDYADLGPKSISFSLGQDDEAVEIMEYVLAAVSPLGDTYIVRNDSRDMSPERFPK